MVGVTVLVKKYKCMCSPCKVRETEWHFYYLVWWLGFANGDEKLFTMVFYDGFRSNAHVR